MPEEWQSVGIMKKNPHPNRANARRIKKHIALAVGYAMKFRRPTKETAVVLNELESALNAVDNVLVTCGDTETYK